MILLIDPSGSNPHRCSPPYMNLKVNKLNYCNFFLFCLICMGCWKCKAKKKNIIANVMIKFIGIRERIAKLLAIE